MTSNLVYVPLAAVVGWALGWASAWLTDSLQPRDDADKIRGRGLLVRDPLVQGGLALVWAFLQFRSPGPPGSAMGSARCPMGHHRCLVDLSPADVMTAVAPFQPSPASRS